MGGKRKNGKGTALGVVYFQNGKLKYRSPSGKVVTITRR